MRPADEAFMARALELAARGLGKTNPNPLVGSVVVKSGRIVGEGFHSRAGDAHAEVEALGRAGKAAMGATLYVNLEPCSHVGRTPPCVPLVVSSGIKRVVAALEDPNPRVSGRGFKALRQAGVAVEIGALRADAEALNRTFLVAARMRRPFVLLKAAMTLDARVATREGESKWITSPEQRRAARALRGCFDGVAVGISTVLADDPLLLPVPHPRRPFHRVVFDSTCRIPLGSRLVRTARKSPVIVLCAPGRKRPGLEPLGVTVLEVPTRNRRVALLPALRRLRRVGVWSLMVEGGSELLGAFLDERILDEVALFRAPLLLGGGLPAFSGKGPRRLGGALRLDRERIPSRFPGFAEGLFELFRP
jgi:diaminohydroxyphosphoribosylaminopyrimidine deaminase/5-amino-6-(5-phosphoribosylamino)uracil reductase